MDLQLTGKRVLVTGGTRGIGRAIVGAFLDEGAVVGFCARDSGDVARTNDELRSRGNVTGSVVDVGDGDALRAWVERSARPSGASTSWWRTSALSRSRTPRRTGRQVSTLTSCTPSAWSEPRCPIWSAVTPPR